MAIGRDCNDIMDNNGDHNLDNLKGRAFDICLAVYRVTNLFPPGEILINQLRQSASQAVVLLAQERFRDTILKVEEMNIFLAIAQEQNWVKPINFILLKNVYYSLVNDLNRLNPAVGESLQKKAMTTPPPEQRSSGQELNSEASKKNSLRLAEFNRRKRQLIDYFQKNKESTVFDLVKVIHGVSARTIRNDLTCLINERVIKKIGDTRSARYILME